MKFVPGDPVMINPDAFENKESFQAIVNSGLDVSTLWPPLSYIGTVIDYMGPNEDALIVQWDHLGDTGYLFFTGELRSAS